MSTAPESKKARQNGAEDPAMKHKEEEAKEEMEEEKEEETEEHRSPGVLQAFRTLAVRRWGAEAADDYELHTRPVSGVGDNSYGHVFQATMSRRSQPTAEPLVAILKVAPKKPARRQHMRIVDFYCREVFMYQRVFEEWRHLAGPPDLVSAITPHMMFASLEERDEFIVFEDLTLSGYVQNFRSNMPTYDLVACALRSLAQLHAMSFVLQAREPQKFSALVSGMNDNLFSAEIAEVSLEFGKKYLRRTGDMLEEEANRSEQRQQMIAYVRQLEQNFRHECFRCVDGPQNAPYAVICHGDFWNNNILYRHDKTPSGGGQAVAAKLIDFQMSRYAPPVLDVINYLFVCIEKDLREAHFGEFLDIYYGRLCQVVDSFEGLRGELLYPRAVFDEQLRQFGVYGLCMASFAIPFFISTNNEIPDLDEVSTAATDLAASSSTGEMGENNEPKEGASNGASAEADEDPAELIDKCRKLVDEYDMLTERSIPIFRRRMFGIVEDLHKYQMLCMSS